MRQKTIVLGIVALAAVLLLVMTAAPAGAFPSKTSACSGCHNSDSGVNVSLTATSVGATSTTYSFTISGPYTGAYGFGVFDAGGTKVAGDYGAAGSFTIANGGSYTFHGVNKDPASMNGYASASLSPTAPPSTPTPLPTSTPTPVPPSPTPSSTPTSVPTTSPTPVPPSPTPSSTPTSVPTTSPTPVPPSPTVSPSPAPEEREDEHENEREDRKDDGRKSEREQQKDARRDQVSEQKESKR